MADGPTARRKPSEPELRRILLFVGLGLLGLFILLFVVMNTDKVEVSFVLFSADVSLIWVILLSAIWGMIAGPLLMRLARRHIVRRDEGD